MSRIEGHAARPWAIRAGPVLLRMLLKECAVAGTNPIARLAGSSLSSLFRSGFSAFVFFKLGTPLVEGHSATIHAVYGQPAFFEGKQVKNRNASKDQQ